MRELATTPSKAYTQDMANIATKSNLGKDAFYGPVSLRRCPDVQSSVWELEMDSRATRSTIRGILVTFPRGV